MLKKNDNGGFSKEASRGKRKKPEDRNELQGQSMKQIQVLPVDVKRPNPQEAETCTKVCTEKEFLGEGKDSKKIKEQWERETPRQNKEIPTYTDERSEGQKPQIWAVT